eukprot:CAMPEP_0172501390 /NCGR_PEP_ID=MMETSP1066-20121228/149358_1 /TAXON_ID=671091 /ORGANISM="Coscinodiscus wailesii, Strain CCMP2513" /LENGTH=442 /DNA_ID=CAMNT_0013276149 /DNA_START=284 /DNA_END=1612 /DNA_ORIENTATION=-
MTWVKRLLTNSLKSYDTETERDDDVNFDDTFRQLLKHYENLTPAASQSNVEATPRTPQPKTGARGSKKGKGKTVWHDGTGKITKSALAELDRSKDTQQLDPDDIPEDSPALREARAAYLPTPEDDDVSSSDDDDTASESWSDSVSNLLSHLSGNKPLEDADLDAPLKEMTTLLLSKNVAQDITDDIINAVRHSLRGKKLGSFTRVSTAVRAALEKTIAKILSPHPDLNLLDAIDKKRRRGQPYVITVVGINGVGKSTTLAKLAYYLQSRGCQPLLVAGDTFRSGAVEQLAVHSKCLDVPLFHKGYAKDPSAVAKEAISLASKGGHDVVLIDTAGRMQNNVPLMRALRKLVEENRPDLVCFVGEALVGNDGVDQLQLFDGALGRGVIGGVILTKFDTVGNKVGAVLSMTRVTTNAKVLFVGVGQKYNHLKRLSVKSILKSFFD